MKLTPREAIITAYALNCLVVDGHPDLNVSNVELQDIAQKFITEASN